MKQLVLVDGNALLHRAYHATPPLTTKSGELINAVYGFTSMLLRSIEEIGPEYILIAWDLGKPTFRHQAYTQYKATRGPVETGLTSQYTRVHQVIKSLNIPEFMLEGYEADDLIGTLATQAMDHKDLEVIVVTGDRDIMQVINDRTKILMPKRTLQDIGLYGVKEFIDRFEFQPIQLIDYKALAGDQSDNIPGVPGIGEVTATKLIKQFESIENLYKPENLATLPPRTQQLLAEGAESAVISKQLATIELKAPIKLDLKTCEVNDYNYQQALDLFTELDFKSLIPRLPGDHKVSTEHKSDGTEKPKISETQPSATTDLDLAVTPVLEKMSNAGVLIDLQFLNKLGEEIKKRLLETEGGIYETVGHEFNLNSPKQLADVLFDELGLPVIRKTKTGRSTDEATLQELKQANPAIPLILEYRQLYKLMSTYIEALPKYIDENNLVHSTFNVDGAATGRLSSTNPNLQNIPIKGDVGGELRKAFIAPKNRVLLGADYSQIELRILAHITDDPNLKKAFTDGIDIHTATASKIFKVSLDEVTKQQRMVGKTVNFATLYGQGPHALSEQLGVDFNTAKTYIEEYFAQFPKVKAWKAHVLAEAEKTGYVETIWGRRRYIPELKSTNRMFKAAGERAAINHPIQGTNADMIKKAMVNIDKEISSNKTLSENCQLILTVHDELMFDCSPDQLKKVAAIVKEQMESVLELSVPVIVELKSGPSWGEMEKLTI